MFWYLFVCFYSLSRVSIRVFQKKRFIEFVHGVKSEHGYWQYKHNRKKIGTLSAFPLECRTILWFLNDDSRLYHSKKNFFIYRVHGTQNDRLELTVWTQKTVWKNLHHVPRYLPKRLKISRFGLATWIFAYFGEYLGTHGIFFKTVFCVETVISCRSFWVPWTL